MGAFYYPNAPVNNITVNSVILLFPGNAYFIRCFTFTTGHDSIIFVDLIQQDTMVATSLTDAHGSYSASIPTGFILV